MTSLSPGSEEQQRLRERFGRSFAAGDVLFREGEPATEGFLLLEGRVRLIKRVGPSERSLRILRSGDLFGEGALVAGAHRTTSAVALTEGSALALEHTTLQQLLAGNPALGARLVQQLIRRLREAEDQIEALMVRDARAKVVLGLLRLAQQAQAAAGTPDGAAVLPVSPVDLSARVGLDPETVKRNVVALREQDYVRIEDERVIVPDVGALRELSELLGTKQALAGP